MNAKQDQRLRMYRAIEEFLTGKDSEVAGLPEFTARRIMLRDTVVLIAMADQEQKNVITGITEAKNAKKDELVALAADNARKVRAFAVNTGDQELAAGVDFNVSQLRRMKDNELKSFAEILHRKAAENIGNLAPYGITEENQKKLSDQLEAYNQVIDKPRGGLIKKSMATKQLEKLFITADDLVAKMDAVIEIIRLTNPVLYEGYQISRKLVDTAGGRVSVRANVTDSGSGEPVRGAVCSFRRDGAPVVRKRSAARGGFMIRNIPAGNYSVHISKNGYRDQDMSVSVTGGERSDLKVKLEKV
jgi:hypothetical protein